MICSFPFTHISDSRVNLLAELLGPVSIGLPAHDISTPQMNEWSQAGRINLAVPADLDASAILGAAQQFKTWAGLHGSQLGDITDFYKLSQGRPPLVDENSPGQISTQIKNLKDGSGSTVPDHLFQSALFLALAHDYDQNQESAAAQMGVVAAMEADMFAHITDGDQAVHNGSPIGPAVGNAGLPLDPGAHMCVQRLQAWACLACHLADLNCVYVTTSTAVLDHLLELFSENRLAFGWNLSPTDEQVSMREARRSALLSLGSAADTQVELPDGRLEGHKEIGSVRLNFHLLRGVAPQSLLKTLSNQEIKPQMQAIDDREWRNSIIGLIES